MLKLAYGTSAFRNRVTLHEMSVNSFFRKLQKPEVRKKKDGNYFILSEFNDLAKKGEKPHSIRNGSNLIRHYGASIDLDHANVDINEIVDAMPECKYIIYTTFSHMLPAKFNEKGNDPEPRYRLVVPYDKPVTHDKHKQLIMLICNQLGIDGVDLSTDAISRPMYLPAVHPSNKKDFDFKIRLKAPLFNTTLSADEEYELAQQLDNTTDVKSFDINETLYEGDGRNDAATKLVGKLIKMGMDLDTTTQTLSAWNQSNCVPPLKKKELARTLKSIVDGHTQRSNSWGYEEIKRRIDESSIDDFDSLITLIAKSDSNIISNAKKQILIRELSKKAKLPLKDVKEEIKRQEILEDEVHSEEEVQKEKLTVKDLREEFSDWVYISGIDKVWHLQKRMPFKTEGFNRMHQHKLDKGMVLPLLLKYNAIKQADRIEFRPGEKEFFKEEYCSLVNTYLPPEINAVEGSVTPMLRHFRKLLPNKEERDNILDYISFIVQKPGKKVLWMPIIKGGKGVGKTVIVEKIITPILGERNVNNVKSKKIGGEFNAWTLDTQLVCFNELKVGTTRKEKLDLTDDLKEAITDNTMGASRKGVDDYQVKNCVNFFALTNHEDAILITPDERRFYLLRSDMILQSKQYYKKLHDYLDDNVEAIYYYFKHRDISNFTPYQLPESAYTNEVKNASLMWPQSVIAEGLEGRLAIFRKNDVTSWNIIVNYLRENSSGRDAMEVDNLGAQSSSQSYRLLNALREAGFRRWNSKTGTNRMRIHGKLETVWLTPEGAEKQRKNGLSKSKIRLQLETQQKIFDFD